MNNLIKKIEETGVGGSLLVIKELISSLKKYHIYSRYFKEEINLEEINDYDVKYFFLIEHIQKIIVKRDEVIYILYKIYYDLLQLDNTIYCYTNHVVSKELHDKIKEYFSVEKSEIFFNIYDKKSLYLMRIYIGNQLYLYDFFTYTFKLIKNKYSEPLWKMLKTKK